ncbi:MAG: peptidoglycan DD-metalloendopeptidase family protein [Ilumatobacter sp.]|nr:peptidoglycan DD-metalloendopeptidase family protein [Ilumatobacter sp.]
MSRAAHTRRWRMLRVAHRRPRRRTLTAACLAGGLLLGSGPALAQDGDEPPTTEPIVGEDAAEKAAREIAEARERANQAAEDYFAAESRLDLLELDRQRLFEEYQELEIEVEELRIALETVAVDRFVASGSTGIPILTDLREPTEQLHGGVLADVAAQTGAISLDDYDEAKRRLREKGEQLDDAEDELEQQKAALLELQSDAEDEVERLRDIEALRLQNEAVVAALLAQQREEARQLAEFERRQAEANRVRQESDIARAAASTVDDTVSGNQGASGGEVGGRTGGGGAGTNPRAAGAGYVDRTIVCPVLGSSNYGDTWGAPRSGGRRHQGVDMLAPTGTPLQAVIGGVVEFRSNVLGGVTMVLFGDNGNRYYYAHLSAYEGVPGYVAQGQVIGYVGDTGNATGVPHLHFEIRPGHGVPVNPYPSVLNAGC